MHFHLCASGLDLVEASLVWGGWTPRLCISPAGSHKGGPGRKWCYPFLIADIWCHYSHIHLWKAPGTREWSAPATSTPGAAIQPPFQVFLWNSTFLGSFFFPYCECVRLCLICTNLKTTNGIHCSSINTWLIVCPLFRGRQAADIFYWMIARAVRKCVLISLHSEFPRRPVR